MKKRNQWKFVVLSFTLLVTMTTFLSFKVQAQPHSSYWHVNELLEWTPESDPDAVYNKGTIPLAQREVGLKVNNHATVKNQVMALSTMYKHTSGAPSQGDDEFDVYTFSYWQYIDKLIMWGGSAGEGTIVAPSSDTINGAHKNGVEVYGTVFFPPGVYGGKVEWIKEFLVKNEEGEFPVADKLIEVAEYYGFEGWFLNQETGGTSKEDAENMQAFIKYCNQVDPSFKIIWYDSMTKDGYVWWQDELNQNNGYFMKDEEGNKVSDSIFLDFGWGESKMVSSHNYAKGIDVDPYMVFSGIEMGSRRGVPDWYIKSSLDAIHGNGDEPRTSLGIFCQSESYKTSDTDYDQFMEREDRFWSGDYVNPSKTGGDWPGIAHYFAAKTAITSYPFVTNFNMGNGHQFFVEGEVKNPNPWHNRSLQDILPTWRWLRESEGQPLEVGFDYEDAYTGGSSLKISGNLNKENTTHVKLYKTHLPIGSRSPEFNIVFKSNQKNDQMEIGLTFASDPEKVVFRKVKTSWKDKWSDYDFHIRGHKGDTLIGISLRFSSEEDAENYQMNIGEISIHKGNELLPDLDDFEIKKASFRDDIYANLEVTWEKNSDVSYYEIYRVLPGLKTEMIGATVSNHYYVQEFKRRGAEKKTTIKVVPVSKTRSRGIPEYESFKWPDYPLPVADFKVSTTFATTTQVVTLTSLSSEVTESVKWSVTNDKDEEVFTSNEKVAEVTFTVGGTYNVALTARNSEGEDTKTLKDLILINDGQVTVSNLALGKLATGDHQVHSGEGFGKAVDGSASTKWCATGDAPHFIQVDLGNEYTLYKFILKHAEEGGESPAWNTYDYQILLSDDGETWMEVVNIEGNTEGVTEHAIKHVKGRYVKLHVTKPTSGGDTAVRLYELEAWGYEQ